MFDLKSFIKRGLLAGYASGQFSAAYISVKCDEFLSKGLLTEQDVEDIASETGLNDA